MPNFVFWLPLYDDWNSDVFRSRRNCSSDIYGAKRITDGGITVIFVLNSYSDFTISYLITLYYSITFHFFRWLNLEHNSEELSWLNDRVSACVLTRVARNRNRCTQRIRRSHFTIVLKHVAAKVTRIWPISLDFSCAIPGNRTELLHFANISRVFLYRN